jgi:hypothetical protein
VGWHRTLAQPGHRTTLYIRNINDENSLNHRRTYATTQYLSVGENSVDVEATGALNIHEEGIGGLNESLQLVLGLLSGRRGVKKIDGHLDYKYTGRQETIKRRYKYQSR